MKSKKVLILLIVILSSMCLFSFSNKVNAMTISDDGEYTLVLNVMDGEIDGNYAKIIKFNVAEGETTVKLSELTKGIVPFNGENEFSHWGKNIHSDEEADEELKIADFIYSGTSGDINYTNGLILWAKFSDKALKGTGTYYLTIDPFAGTINGKVNLRLTSKQEEFKTIDLTKYIPVREGYTFKGWDLNGRFVTSIDSSAFANCDAVNVTATYTKNSFEGDDRVLVLNANGGTIDGKSSNKYDYVGGANSGTAMSLLPYVPVREGYTFNGWNTKKDGSGKNFTYIYWRLWDKDNSVETEKDTLIFDGVVYQNLTLYATWTKNPETPVTPENPEEDKIKELQNDENVKTNLEFPDGIYKNYILDIKEVDIENSLKDKAVKFIADINVMDGNSIVKINNTKMKIKIAIPDDLKGYDKYEVVYILNDEIKETLPATIENGYIVFETSHLSQYGIVATNVKQESGTKTENTSNNENPKTSDNIMIDIILFTTSMLAIATVSIINIKTRNIKNSH